MEYLRIVVAAAAVLTFSACTVETNPTARTAADPAVAFDGLEVAEDFTFAMRRDVKLQLQASQPDVAKYVEISDDEGRRLFAGAVLGNLDLDFDVRTGSQPVLNVRVGKGDAAVSQSVTLVDGRGAASF